MSDRGTVNIIGERLKQLREERRLSQGQLAVRSHLKQPTISRIEAGLRPNISFGTARALANALNIPIQQLVSGAEPTPVPVLPSDLLEPARRYTELPTNFRPLVLDSIRATLRLAEEGAKYEIQPPPAEPSADYASDLHVQLAAAREAQMRDRPITLDEWRQLLEAARQARQDEGEEVDLDE